jgi:hypothetical protein
MKTMTFTSKGRVDRPTVTRKAVLLLGLAGLLSIAAPRARADEETDPPTRVARISFVDGSVSFQAGGEGDWGSAAKNRPVTIGDKIWVDKDSRAELQAGQAGIHLGSMTALSFLNLDQSIIQMRLAEGSVNFRVRELREGDLYEVDAPNLAFTVRQAGAFRIDVDETGGSARVTVLRGEGEVTAEGKTYPVHAGERAEFQGTDNIEYSVERAPGPDGLDRWAEERDLKEDNSASARYISRDTVGYSDLDDHGSWSEVPDYGPVWYPNEVAVGWAPYSDGYWNWVGPWGWTWVDYAPWGFAPFHYGRWNYFGGRWGWCPGPYYGSPVYGPAFVGFLGDGFGFSAGFGFGGGIGWFPLGFGEPFYPWFGCRHEFFERINERNTFISNRNVFNTNIHNVNFVNAHNVNAVTVANHNAFVNGQAINRGATHLTAASLKGAQVTNSVGLKPTPRSSLGAVNMNSHVARPSVAVQNRSVMARTTPAQAASHFPVRTVNSRGLTAGRVGNSPVNSSSNRPAMGAGNQRAGTANAPAAINGHSGNSPNTSGMTSRQRELSQSRPPSAATNSARTPNATMNNNSPQQRAGSSGPRTWAAQGNTTDRGRAPTGFGGSNRPSNAPAQTAGMPQGNRPPWAGTGSQSSVNGSVSRPAAPNYNGNRPSYSNNSSRSSEPPQRTYNNNTPSYGNRGSSNTGRTYEPPQRAQRDTPAYNNNRSYSQPRSYNSPPTRSYSAPQTYSAPGRSYSAPSGSYSAPSRNYSAPSGSYSAPSHSYSAPSRSYSAPSRSYSAPSRSYSAPSHSYSGGGGGNRGAGSGGSGGSPHGGGGSVSHGRH